MNNVVAGYEEIIDSSNNDLGEKKAVVTLEDVAAGFDIPLNIFHYKDYNSDFFTSWYNVASGILKEINKMCPEKRVLNLALSVLMLPNIASIALGLVVYNRFKVDSKTQVCPEKSKTTKSEVSESTAKRLTYSVLVAMAIPVDVAVLLVLIAPAALALTTFYLFNKKLSHSLVTVLKISNGLYKNEHQNIEVSFHEIDAGESDIRWDMEIKLPPQFEQLLRDLYSDENDKLFVTRDAERNTILKLSANIHLKNGLVPLRNEIRNVLTTSIQGFTEIMGELLKLDNKDITYDKLKELLNKFRPKVVDSVDPKLTSHLMQDAYRVAFIQAIKIARKRREEKGGFVLEERLKEVLVEQELKNQGKELPTEKEIIIEDLKKAGEEVPDTLKDSNLPMLRAQWKQLIEKGKIAKKTIIDNYRNAYPQETAEALCKAEVMIKELKSMEEKRYEEICEELRKIHRDIGKNNSKDDALKRKLEDLFKFEHGDQEVERRLIRSVIKRAKSELRQSSILDKEEPGLVRRLTQSAWDTLSQDREEQSLMKWLEDLEKEVEVLSSEEASNKVNDFIERMYLEIKRHKVQGLLQKQKEGVLYSCKVLKRYELDLAETVEAFRKQDLRYLEESALEQTLKDQNECLKVKLNDRLNEYPSMESIRELLKRNEEILETLEQLELGKKRLLINEETKNDYREELTSREKIKFAIIEDDLLKVFKQETFNEAKIKDLLEKTELEYCLAEKCIKYPVIKTKDNIKHFCQDLLSPLINRLLNLIISNIPKDNKNIAQKAWSSLWTGLGYIRVGLSATVINKNSTAEGKALDVAHNTYKEVETFLQYFESSYEKVGGLIGNVFSDDGKTFKEHVWPQIQNHLCRIWYRFFKDIEFTPVSRELSEVNVTQQQQKVLLFSS